MSIKAQIKHLAELQTVENEIRKLKHVLAQIPEELKTLDSQLFEFKEKIDNTEKNNTSLEKQYRDWEGDSQGVTSKIEQENSKLNSVKNNKEYQALLLGIEHLKSERSTLEDQMLESLETMDEAKAKLTVLNEEYGQLESRLNRERVVIGQRSERKKAQLEVMEKSKADLMGNIELAVMKRYNHAKTLRGDGLAIVAVQDEMCRGCNMNIPPQLYNELQRYESLLTCPNCQRIIYHEPPEDSSVEPST